MCDIIWPIPYVPYGMIWPFFGKLKDDILVYRTSKWNRNNTCWTKSIQHFYNLTFEVFFLSKKCFILIFIKFQSDTGSWNEHVWSKIRHSTAVWVKNSLPKSRFFRIFTWILMTSEIIPSSLIVPLRFCLGLIRLSTLGDFTEKT